MVPEPLGSWLAWGVVPVVDSAVGCHRPEALSRRRTAAAMPGVLSWPSPAGQSRRRFVWCCPALLRIGRRLDGADEQPHSPPRGPPQTRSLDPPPSLAGSSRARRRSSCAPLHHPPPHHSSLATAHYTTRRNHRRPRSSTVNLQLSSATGHQQVSSLEQ